jgi:CRP-like cAMP-binding protein
LHTKARCFNPFCTSIQPHIRNSLCSISSCACYPAKQTFSIDIGKDGKLLLITKGVVIVIRQRPDGKQLGSECLEKGDIIGISNLFRAKKDTAIFFTKTEVEGCLISSNDFGNLCLDFSDLGCEVIRNISQRFALVVNNLEHITLDNSTEKILYLIKKLSYERSASLPDHIFSFTHEELALLAGINRVTASRVIDKLKQLGILVPVGKGKFKLKDQKSTDILMKIDTDYTI